MQMSQMHYLPLAPGFFAILVGFFFIVLVLRSVRYAYESLGVSSNAAIFLLFATLIGSIFNIPIAELPPERVASDQVIDFSASARRSPRSAAPELLTAFFSPEFLPCCWRASTRRGARYKWDRKHRTVWVLWARSIRPRAWLGTILSVAAEELT